MNTKESSGKNSSCMVKETLSLISSKWTMHILRELCQGTIRFGELKKSMAGISPKTLSSRLQELEYQGIVNKKIYAEVPPRVEYSLTLRGESLKDILLALFKWGETNLDVKDGVCKDTLHFLKG